MQKVKRVPQDRQMMKYAARMLLSGRVFVCFLACIIPAALPWVMRLIPVSFGVVNFLVADVVLYGISLPMMLLSFAATTFVTDPMSVRVAGFFLTLNRDAEHLPSPLSVCDCFGPGYLRLVGSMLLRSIYVMAWTAVPLVIGALVPGTWEMVEVMGVEAIRLTNLGYLFILLAVTANLYRSLGYTMVPYLLIDHPEIGPVEALRRSRYITRGRIGELLVLELSFLGWLMLVSVTFMIGAVYVYPYIESTMAGYYLAFIQPLPYEKNESEATDAP